MDIQTSKETTKSPKRQRCPANTTRSGQKHAHPEHGNCKTSYKSGTQTDEQYKPV